VNVRSEKSSRKQTESEQSEELKHLMIVLLYVHIVHSMLHVNAMRMDAKREHKQKNTKTPTKKRHSSNAMLAHDSA
jgi:hypothetical protein